MIMGFSGADPLASLPRGRIPGLYIVRSTKNPDYIRIGKSADLRNRMRTHRRKEPGAFSRAPNWTEAFRSWHPLWVADLSSFSDAALAACEVTLLAHFAQRYPLIDESGFLASPELDSNVIEEANGLLSALTKVAEIQTGRLFDKHSYWQGVLAERAKSIV